LTSDIEKTTSSGISENVSIFFNMTGIKEVCRYVTGTHREIFILDSSSTQDV